MKLTGASLPEGGATTRVEAIRATAEAWALLEFVLSENHFEARKRTGADQQ